MWLWLFIWRRARPIAATALAHEATLVTANKRHFENIEGLKVEVWPIG